MTRAEFCPPCGCTWTLCPSWGFASKKLVELWWRVNRVNEEGFSPAVHMHAADSFFYSTCVYAYNTHCDRASIGSPGLLAAIW